MNPFYGVNSVELPESDYRSTTFPIPRFTFSGTEYSQNEIDPNSCTLHGVIGAVSDLTSFKFSLSDRKEIFQSFLDDGFKNGYSLHKAVDKVRQWYNRKFTNDKLHSHRLTYRKFFTAMSLGYSIVVAYRGNEAFNLDRDDGRLDEVEFGKPTLAHCLRATRSKAGQAVLIDNYPEGKRPNRIDVSNFNLRRLVKNNVFVPYAYVFVFANDKK